ncbi:MAG: DUF3160 domain-containing protein [Bacteroidales bacterium]|jgi:hypothetical protein|nr:DUF3160 domain-containing protein [Bacteroidales bacterium]
MKKFIFILLLIIPMGVMSQSQFSPKEYMDFREANKSLTTQDLLDLYPPQTTYYSSRTHEPDLTTVSWFDSINHQYDFTSEEMGLLRQNYFMVSERLSYPNWIGSLADVYNRDLPLFLSTDLILFTLHQSYDEILKQIEIKILEPNLITLLNAMHAKFSEVYAKYDSNPDLLPSLEDVDLFIAVAQSLVLNERIAPKMTDPTKYDMVMTAVKSEKMVEMPLFTRADLDRKLDFSQFTPRGHYTDDIYTLGEVRTLENYFRGMMWLGRIDFLLTPPPSNPWEADWEQADILRMNLSALLLNEVLNSCGEKDLLDLHEELISFMVGPDDNLTPDELSSIYSNNLDEITDLFDNEKFEDFKSIIQSSDDSGQKIMSNFFFVDPDTVDPSDLPISFKLLGQKFLIDSYIFSEVVFDRIVTNGEKQYRMLPNPLDVLSVFGNENAMSLMAEEMEEYHYAYKISELKYLVDEYDAAFWTQSLYNTWLDALIKLNPPSIDEGLPYFMKTTAWQHEKLNTQLTSWAQLRHDNLLYGKQSYTGGTGCSFPYTYVEPYPNFYEHLILFASSASLQFEELLGNIDQNLTTQITNYYDYYSHVMGMLKGIAEKELDGQVLGDEELTFLKTMINFHMESGNSITGWINDLLFPSMDPWDFDYTVADVHTQPTDPGGAVVGNVLHVGNGNINLGLVIAPSTSDPSRLMCYIGPLGSFHSKVEKNFKRLSDEEWKKLFFMQENPSRPEWAYTYLATTAGDTIQAENVLKGEEYTGIDYVSQKKNSIDYLLVFPNPAKESVHFRFILSEATEVNAELFDITGRKVRSVYSGVLPASEQDVAVDLDRENPGVYILRIKVNQEVYLRKFVIQ